MQSKHGLAGQIPNAFERLAHLEFLDLSSNMLEGEIPKSLGNLSHLRVLVLVENDLKGNFGEFVGNLSGKGMLVQSLEILDLDTNHLTGSVPDLRAFSALTEVYLGNNRLTGSVPLSLGQLSKLEVLDVSRNGLEGIVSESHLTKLENLIFLDLSFYSLILQISPDWNPPFKLDVLLLAGCSSGPLFPKWIQTQRNLNVLDLSRAGIIIDEVPMWLWSFSPALDSLFLSDNQISGTIPDLSSTPLIRIDLSSNNFSGPIPLFHPNTMSFQLRQNMFFGSISSICNVLHDHLYFLDLSYNLLSGEIPDCWEKTLPNLEFLNLGNNRFLGTIRHSLGSLPRLRSLRLRDNNLSGELPSTLRFCQELHFVDIGGNELITGEIPAWIGELYQINYLILQSNKFYGSIPPEICNLTHIHILDISFNNLSGRIPDCFNNLAALANKDSPKDRLYVGVLSGKIPSSTQLQGFDVSSYAGNNGLCGPPLVLCPQDRPRPPTTTQGEKDDGLSFVQGVYISMAFGFILGFWGVVAPIILKKSWRFAYFNFLDAVGDWFYVKRQKSKFIHFTLI